MPLTRVRKANLWGGIGNDFARAVNPNIQPWKDIEEPKLGTPNAAVILGQTLVTRPVTTMRDVETAPGRASLSPTGFLPDITPPTTEKQPFTENVTKPYVQWEAEENIESKFLDNEKKRKEREVAAINIKTRKTVETYFLTEAAREEEDSPWGKILKVAAVFSLDPEVKADDLFKRVIELKKGRKEDIDQFADYFQGLKDYAGIDLNNPLHMKALLTPGSPEYNKAKGLIVMLKKDVMKIKDEATGNTKLFQVLPGNKTTLIGELKTGKSFAQERKETATLEEDKAIIQKKYREPRETTADKVNTAEAIERMKIRVNQDKPLTVTEKEGLIRTRSTILKTIVDPKTEAGQIHLLLKSWYEISPNETSIPYYVDEEIKSVILPLRKGKRVTAKNILDAANLKGLTIEQTLKAAGYIK